MPADYRRAIQGIKIESPVIKINMAVSELPKFLALTDDEQLQGSTGGLFIAPSIDYLQTRVLRARNWVKPATHPFMNIHMQSAIDRSRSRPVDKHTISIFTQYFPYTLAEGTWDERREEIADNVIAEFAKFAPNIPDAIIARQVLAPPDIEARFGLTGGHIFQGELVPGAGVRYAPRPWLLVLRRPHRWPVPLRLRRLARRLRNGRARP